MRKPRVYLSETLRENTSYSLDGPSSQHLNKVLRLKPGDEIILFDGEGTQIDARIADNTHGLTRVVSLNQPMTTCRSPVEIHLGLAISKGDRMDYAIQKSVEAGVGEITPITTERTIVRLDSKREKSRIVHWQGVVLNACEQCGQNYRPQLNHIMSLQQWAQQPSSGLNLVFDLAADQALHQLQPASRVRIVIGPEGGLSDNELAMLEQYKFIRTKLGPRVLRSETAAVAASIAIQTLWGDYKD